MDNLKLFRVKRDDDSTLGWGVSFPEGECYIEWNRFSYDEHNRLDNPHVSMYGSLDDLNHATGGIVEMIYEQPVDVKR